MRRDGTGGWCRQASLGLQMASGPTLIMTVMVRRQRSGTTWKVLHKTYYPCNRRQWHCFGACRRVVISAGSLEPWSWSSTVGATGNQPHQPGWPCSAPAWHWAWLPQVYHHAQACQLHPGAGEEQMQLAIHLHRADGQPQLLWERGHRRGDGGRGRGVWDAVLQVGTLPILTLGRKCIGSPLSWPPPRSHRPCADATTRLARRTVWLAPSSCTQAACSALVSPCSRALCCKRSIAWPPWWETSCRWPSWRSCMPRDAWFLASDASARLACHTDMAENGPVILDIFRMIFHSYTQQCCRPCTKSELDLGSVPVLHIDMVDSYLVLMGPSPVLRAAVPWSSRSQPVVRAVTPEWHPWTCYSARCSGRWTS